MSSTADQLRQYAGILWDDFDIIELRPLPPQSGKREWITASDIAEDSRVSRMLENNQAGANLFAGVLPRITEGGGKSEDVEGGRVVWADFDNMTAEDAIAITGQASFPIPSMAVATGHGAHLFWRLDKWERKERICQAVRGVIALFGCDKSAKDPARILRLPGFINHKPPAATSEIVYADEFTAYALDDLLSFLPEESTITEREIPSALPVVSGSKDLERARRYIQTIPGSAEGGRTHSAYRVAAVLTIDYQLEDSQALPLLHGWDLMNNVPPIQHDPKYGEKELIKLIDNVRRYHKKSVGDKLQPDVEINIPMVDTRLRDTGAAEPITEERKTVRQLSGKRVLAPYMQPGGILQQICEYIDAGAYCVQPELSLAAAVAFFGAVLGRTVKDETNTRTNLYVIGTAPSGSGKDRALAALNDIAAGADMMEIIGPSGFRSGSALLKTVAATPQIIALIDEAGLFFRGVSIAGKTSSHATEIISNILALYSRSASVYKPIAAAGYSLPEINQPSLSIYGATVPDSLYDGLPKEAISNGFFARTLIVPGREKPAEKEPVTVDVPEALCQALRGWKDKARSVGNLAQENPKPFLVPFETGVKEFYLARRKECKERGRAAGEPLATLWTRAVEIGKRVALIHACSLDCHTPTLTLESARWGCGFVEAVTELMVQNIRDNVVENESERSHKRVAALIRSYKGGITKSELTRKTQWIINRRVRDDILDTLLESRDIKLCDGSAVKSGFSPMVYKATGA